MVLSSFFGSILALIVLEGPSGQMTARAEFDSNNVRLGDPMELAISFEAIENGADFKEIHPPQLSAHIDESEWRVDDASAKTETLSRQRYDFFGRPVPYACGRKITYRLRPLKEGVLVFPGLEFAWGEGGADVQGEATWRASCKTRPIPVHVKAAPRAALSDLDEAREELPMPDGLVYAVESCRLSQDEDFAWRKAFGELKADSFAAFDFPEARLNEAALRIVEGDWAKALKIYYRLEWSIGQTKEIERGIVAALARKTGDRNAELPAWRQVARPILKFGWKGRLAMLLSISLALALFFLASSFAIKKLAAIAAILFACANISEVRAESPEEEFFREISQMGFSIPSPIIGNRGANITISGNNANIQSRSRTFVMSSSGLQQETIETVDGKTYVNGKLIEPPAIEASVAMFPQEAVAGEEFDFILSLDIPKDIRIEKVDFAPNTEIPMLGTMGYYNLPATESPNPSNRIVRISRHVRCDAPFKGEVAFTVVGQYMTKELRQIGLDFSKRTSPLAIEIKSLPGDEMPEDFSGIIGKGLSFRVLAKKTDVATNEVIKIERELRYSPTRSGCYIPRELLQEAILRDTRSGVIKWQDYFVADGHEEIPSFGLVYFDIAAKKYSRLESKAVQLKYSSEEEEDELEAVEVDSLGEKPAEQLELLLAPSSRAPVVETLRYRQGEENWREIESHGDWIRIETSTHSGWIKKGAK